MIKRDKDISFVVAVAKELAKRPRSPYPSFTVHGSIHGDSVQWLERTLRAEHERELIEIDRNKLSRK